MATGAVGVTLFHQNNKHMFTLEQLKAAHAKVKTGADFPRYIQEIKALGLVTYIYNVADGSTAYYGDNNHQMSAPAIYPAKVINTEASADQLRHTIAVHQQGQTDFLTFCTQAAAAGVKQWVIDTVKMACIYQDINGNNMVVEPIPEENY